MSTFAQAIEADARLAILAELASQGDATLNSQSITRVLDAAGIRRSREWVETQLGKLEELGAVTLRQLDLASLGPTIIAELTRAGRDHVERRSRIAGVAPPADRF